MRTSFTLGIIFCFVSFLLPAQQRSSQPRITPAGKGKVVPYADNIGYWMDMVKKGYVQASIATPWVPAKTLGSAIRAVNIPPQDSPDIPVTSADDVTQSENSVFIDPDNEDNVLNSNNSTGWALQQAQAVYGADYWYSLDDGQDWSGSPEGAGDMNRGDPCTAISLDGRWYVGMIDNTYGQSIAYSTDQGHTWTSKQVAPGPGTTSGLLDKNHLWVDDSPFSAFKGNIYAAWTNFITGSADSNQIQVTRSNNGGLHWYSPFTISRGVNAGSFNHGVNIATGPGGQVYVAWSIYDSWPSDENAIGFTRSVDGGATWLPSYRIISNIKGIRTSLTGKNMRVNSFPSMAIDITSGPNNGTIYLVWTNVGVPGINTGNDINVYMIKSTDEGTTWSIPIKVNQDPPGQGKEHYFCWITCDAVTGGLCVIYYDDRNVSSTDAETWVSYSYDGGNSWTDFRVSDVSFTPSPIPGLAYDYFGDYLGIQSRNMKVYPVWTDNRLAGGQTMSWTSPFNLGPNPGQPWVMYYSNDLFSIPGGAPSVLKFGDSLHLSLGIKNIGDQDAANLLAKVTSPSPYITMTDSVEPYGSLAAGATEVVPNGFAFKISDTIPDGLMVRFNVKVSDNDTAWYSHFDVASHAPGLKIGSLTINDNSGGNHNGRFDPGETTEVVVSIANSGDYPCPNTYCILTTDSPYLTIQNDSVYIDTVKPFWITTAHYTVIVSDTAPASAAANLYCTARSGIYVCHAEFQELIGIIVEDWESDSFNKFPWHFGGITSWNITRENPYEGQFCAVSGPIGDNQNTQLNVTYTSAADDSISFYFRTSTEQDYDFLSFTIDQTLQYQWSGENPWTRASFAVPAGTHTFKWIYQKDMAGSSGSDQVGIDFIVFPGPIVPDISIVKEDTICAGYNYILQAEVNKYDSLHWYTTGDGTFSNDTAIRPVYTPGSLDIINGNVKLRLTAFSSYGRSQKSTTLTIAGLPVAEISVYPKDSVCSWQTITLSADTTGVSHYLWSPGNITTQLAVIDTAIAGGTGTKLFHLKTWNKAGCFKTDSVWLTFKNCLGIENGPGLFSAVIYPNPTPGRFTLEIYTPSEETISISIENVNQEIIYEEKDDRVSGQYKKNYNFAGLSPGMYLFKIRKKDGTIIRKLIIGN
jgi:hypothetical protein